MFDSQVEGATY